MEDLAKAPAPYLAEQVCVPGACMVMVVESSTGRVWGPHTLLTCQGGSCEGAPYGLPHLSLQPLQRLY